MARPSAVHHGQAQVPDLVRVLPEPLGKAHADVHRIAVLVLIGGNHLAADQGADRPDDLIGHHPGARRLLAVHDQPVFGDVVLQADLDVPDPRYRVHPVAEFGRIGLEARDVRAAKVHLEGLPALTGLVDLLDGGDDPGQPDEPPAELLLHLPLAERPLPIVP